jgi:hypothetical protein
MRGVFCDDVGDLCSIGALDRHQHHAGIVKNRRIFRQRQLVRGNPSVEALEACQPQPVAFDLGNHARPRQQGDLATSRRQHAADNAADAAGPGDADRSLYRHALRPALVQLSFN